MSEFVSPNTGPEDTLLLHPQGYPVYIDVPQHRVGGAASFMRFKLPLKGHNFPLCHHRENKVIVALQGELEVRTGIEVISVLKQGQAIVIPPGRQHRILQSGTIPSEVGIVLRPGLIEIAFRDLAEIVRRHGYSRILIADHLKKYDVKWDTGEKNRSDKYNTSPVSYSEIVNSLATEIDETLVNVWSWKRQKPTITP
jgi:hypothetical protein